MASYQHRSLMNVTNKLKVVNEILDLIHDHGVGDELGEAYQEGYCDAVDDIYNTIMDYYEQTST